MQSPEVSTALTTLAQQLGTTVDMVWQIALTLPKYNALKSAVWAVMWACLAIPMGVVFVRVKRERDRLLARREYVPDEVDFQCLVSGALAAVCIVVSVVYWFWSLGHLIGVLNPQAYAMQVIFSALSK